MDVVYDCWWVFRDGREQGGIAVVLVLQCFEVDYRRRLVDDAVPCAVAAFVGRQWNWAD